MKYKTCQAMPHRDLGVGALSLLLMARRFGSLWVSPGVHWSLLVTGHHCSPGGGGGGGDNSRPCIKP